MNTIKYIYYFYKKVVFKFSTLSINARIVSLSCFLILYEIFKILLVLVIIPLIPTKLSFFKDLHPLTLRHVFIFNRVISKFSCLIVMLIIHQEIYKNDFSLVTNKSWQIHSDIIQNFSY